MSPIFLHGLIPSETGYVADAPAHLHVALGPVTALVSTCPEPPADEQASIDAILLHDRLLNGYLAEGPVLPVRFGTCFTDMHRLGMSLSAKAAALRSSLDELTGLAEYALSVETESTETAAEPPGPEALSGRTFLKARKALRDRQDASAADREHRLRFFHHMAISLAKDSDLRPPRPPRLMSLSLLMDSLSAHRLRNVLAESATGFTAQLTGPFPAYSFADAAIGGGCNAE